MGFIIWQRWSTKKNPGCAMIEYGIKTHSNRRFMTNRNFEKELCHSYYRDMEDGNNTETICYPSLICIITELCDRIEQLESEIETLNYNLEKND